jgi:hypothetical protein
MSPIIFKLDDKTYRVKKIKWNQNKFKPDHAYTMGKYNGYVYPYRGKITDMSLIYLPGIYIYDDKVIVRRPRTKEEKLAYSEERLIILTPDMIFQNLDDVSNDMQDIIITDGDVFKPAITSNDDIALAGMKFAIGEKNINFNTYAHKFSDTATKNNGRRALTHGNTLKMDMLTRFGEVFDIEAALLFWDKKNCPNPMCKNNEKKVFVIYNNEPINLKDPELRFEEITKK